MSCFLVFHNWTGEDADDASSKLAKLFRMDPEEASAIVAQLAEGKKWKFPNQISESQGDTARNFLNQLGFEVERVSAESFINLEEAPPPPEEKIEEVEDDPELLTEGPTQPFAFSGIGWDLFKLLMKNLGLTIVTVGLYKFWGKTYVRQFLYSQTSFAKDRFTYHGTGKELLIGWLKVVIKLAIIFFIFSMVGLATGTFWVEGLLQFVFLLFAIPWLMVGARRYRLSRSSWRGIRFSFKGERKTAVKIYVKGFLLNTLTLSLYYPIFNIDTTRFWLSNSCFGNREFHFTGQGKDVWGKSIIGLALSFITMGLYYPWYRAFIQRYIWSHTCFGKAYFQFPVRGGELFVLYLKNFFHLLFTLGLGYAWVITRTQKFVLDRLVLTGDIDINKIVQEIRDSDAQGEEGLDFMDADFDFG